MTSDFETVLVQHHNRFLRWIERRIGNPADAEELLQKAMLRAVEKGIPAEDTDGIVNWFYRVLNNAVIDHYRARSTRDRALETEARQSPDALDPELRNAVCACVRDAVTALKPEYAELVQRVDLDDQPVPEAARAVGITANNAGVRLHRARQALRKELEKMCGACAEHGCLDCGCRKGRAELTYEPR